MYQGFCEVCRCPSRFAYDWLYGDEQHINWRERLVCESCKLSNRLRLAVAVASGLVELSSARVYLTEQVTPLASVLAAKCPGLTCSEYLGPGLLRGEVSASGVRHEDLTQLSFPDRSFDLALSFDVLEHVPDFRRALGELHRILSPGGSLLLSVPMHLGSESHIVRARIGADGAVQHLMEPEYHGDPIDPAKGVLCYYHFGWELLADLASAGFVSSEVQLFWSRSLAHIGGEQALVLARA